MFEQNESKSPLFLTQPGYSRLQANDSTHHRDKYALNQYRKVEMEWCGSTPATHIQDVRVIPTLMATNVKDDVPITSGKTSIKGTHQA